ncbi:hypothetical protein JTE90_025043 [Oedothorax gibbosus]|uniref:Uncharacterized protein n=1 Tax=Oedothorax gibbosus TaxID=931172 RepID=A0AAV6TS19_9ARAC|nr:hypothetical protein JTE90_025043 [Oedothorax gibbosus]
MWRRGQTLQLTQKFLTISFGETYLALIDLSSPRKQPMMWIQKNNVGLAVTDTQFSPPFGSLAGRESNPLSHRCLPLPSRL